MYVRMSHFFNGMCKVPVLYLKQEKELYKQQMEFCQTPVEVDVGVDDGVDFVFPCHKNKKNKKNLT